MAVGVDMGAIDYRAFAATWRDEADQVAATTWGGTVCWFPRRPGTLRIEREGFEHIIRCGECPGCLELNRRRLADRLCAKYSDHSRELWLVRIYAPAERHARLSHNLHRRPSLKLEPGLFRFGVSSFGVLTRNKHAAAAAVHRLGLDCRVERIKFRRGRRAWRSTTAGLMVSREIYGANLNRYYCRGLPPAPRESWHVTTRPYQTGYSRLSSPRAWSGDKLVLVPPEVWRLRRADRRKVRELLRKASNPEAAAEVIKIVAAVANKLAPSIPVIAAAERRLAREQTQLWYKRKVEQIAAAASAPPSEKILPSLSEERGYRSSVHSSSADPPKLLSDEELLKPGASGKERWQERELERERLRPQVKAAERVKNQAWIDEWLERNTKKLKE